MIYGHALGPPAQSVQIPALVRQAKASGVVRYIGARIESMVQRPYRRCRGALSIGAGQGASGTFIYVESGEEALGQIAKAIAAQLGFGAPQSWNADEAIAAWGRNKAVFSLGSNSRVRGKIAAELGWSPARRSVTRWIAEDLLPR